MKHSAIYTAVLRYNGDQVINISAGTITSDRAISEDLIKEKAVGDLVKRDDLDASDADLFRFLDLIWTDAS